MNNIDTNTTTNNNHAINSQQVGELIDKYIGLTPAGAYCKIQGCGKHFATSNWRKHFTTYHKSILESNFPTRVENIISILNFRISSLNQNGNLLDYAKSPRKCYTKRQCLHCKRIFRDANQANLHLISTLNSCPQTSEIVKIKCIELVCGRFVPDPRTDSNISNTQEISDEQTPIATSVPPTADLPDYAKAVLPSPSDMRINPALRYTSYFTSLPPNIMIQDRMVDSIITQLIEKDDITKNWMKIFDKYIATNDFFIEWLSTTLASDNLNPQVVIPSNIALRRLMELYTSLEERTFSIVHQMPANIKASLVKFEVQKEDEMQQLEGANTWSFRNRTKSSTQISLFANLLCFLHAFQCPTLQKYLRLVTQQDYVHDEANRTGIIARMIYELTVELPQTGDDMPWIYKFSLFNCFHLVNRVPKLKSAGTCGKSFATVLYVVRQCVLACASMMLSSGNQPSTIISMIKPVQQGHVINLVSPCIAYCRDMTSHQAKSQTSWITKDGDIICGKSTFRKVIYNQLIPKVRTAICNIFSTLFIGNEWKLFVNNKHPIRVSHIFVQCSQCSMIFTLLTPHSFIRFHHH